jgi:integrase
LELKFEAGERVGGRRQTRYLTVTGTKRQAAAELTRVLAEVDRGAFVEPNRLTVAEYLERWLLDQARHRVSAKTFERYAEIVRKHLVPALGAQRLAKLTPLYMPVLLAATTGMRRGEVLALRWSDLDLDRGVLSVAQTIEQTACGVGFKEPKTERSRRTIALPLLTVDELRRHKLRQTEARLALGPLYVNHDLVCCRPDGRPLSPRAVTKAFAARAAALGLKVRFHDLRHSHISHLLAAGVHPKVASERAGHAGVAITPDTYSHLIPGMQEDAAARIDAALRTHLER